MDFEKVREWKLELLELSHYYRQGFLLPLQSFAQLGSSILTFARLRFDSFMFILDSANLGVPLSLQSPFCLDPFSLSSGCSWSDSVVLVLDFLHLDAMSLPRGPGQAESATFASAFSHLAPFLLSRSTS